MYKQDFSFSCLTPSGGGPNLAASSFIPSLRSSLFSVHPAKLAQILFIPILTSAVSSSQTSLILVLPCAFKIQLVKYVPCLSLRYMAAFSPLTCPFSSLFFNRLNLRLFVFAVRVIHSFCLYIYLLSSSPTVSYPPNASKVFTCTFTALASDMHLYTFLCMWNILFQLT